MLFRRAEIAVLDIEPADDHTRFVGQRELLVIAQQIAATPAGHEAAHVHSCPLQRIEEVAGGGVLAAQPVYDQMDLHAALRGRDQRIADRGAGRVVDIDVIEHP